MDDLQERVQAVRSVFEEHIFEVDNYLEHHHEHQFMVSKGDFASSVGEVVFSIEGEKEAVRFEILPIHTRAVVKNGKVNKGKVLIEGNEINQWKDLEVFIG